MMMDNKIGRNLFKRFVRPVAVSEFLFILFNFFNSLLFVEKLFFTGKITEGDRTRKYDL